MSWSTSTPKVAKADAEEALNNLTFKGVLEPAALEQVAAAKRAVIELLKTVPGPFVIVSLNGHANGVGWQRKEGYANDMISVSVTQFINEQPHVYG